VRFKTQITLRVEAATLEEAESAIDAAAAAAYDALGPAQVPDDPEGLYSGSTLPLDDDATAALTADDHGPGRNWSVAVYGREPTDDS
jgi:hypothetical protein